MNGGGESYSGVVPAKRSNEGQGGPQEIVERRPLTEKNTPQPNSNRTPSRGNERSGLERVRQAAKEDKGLRFTALLHHVNIELLRSSYQSLKKQAAAGVDGVTWEEYGFRPGRSQQDALDALSVGITQKKVNWVLDLDIRSFFDKVGHDWMVKFVEHRIGDTRIVRLIQKWLKAGVMEDGRWFETKEGTPQGSVISPILANLYLHYVLDVWAKAWREKVARGEMIIVRYADDAVLGFQYREDAERFLEQLQERLRKFGLELHPDKTRLIEFGRFAAERRRKRGEGKPETFNFLGFTHICGRSRETGYFTVHRKTMGKRMASKLKEIRRELARRRHASIVETKAWLITVVRGYFQYHALPDNQQRMKVFRADVLRAWLRQLRRRSQRSRWSWERFLERLGNALPAGAVLHPWPRERFAARHSR